MNIQVFELQSLIDQNVADKFGNISSKQLQTLMETLHGNTAVPFQVEVWDDLSHVSVHYSHS